MRIWVDMTAAAHPLVLRPVIERLEERGDEVAVTAREYGQTLGILERLGIPYEAIGRHGGATIAGKGFALARRSAALARWARRQRFTLSLAHGSVDLAVVSALLRVPSVQMQDYEHAGLQRRISWRLARRVIVPDAIPLERVRKAGARPGAIFRYPGLKEDYYLADFEPDAAVLAELGLDRLGIKPERADDDRVFAIVRPPPETSAYHTDNPLYEEVLRQLADEPATVAMVIPRTDAQAAAIRARGDPSLLVPDRAVDAQSLIAFADVVISAGGTMNREAVALGTPVYTIFSGPMGAVDEALIAAGRLRPLTDLAHLHFEKRDAVPGPREPRDPSVWVEAIVSAAGD